MDAVEIRGLVRMYMAHARTSTRADLVELLGQWLPEVDARHALIDQMLDADVLRRGGSVIYSNDPEPQPNPIARPRWQSPAEFADVYDLPESFVIAAVDTGELRHAMSRGDGLIDMVEAEPWALALRAELERMGEL